MYYREALKLQAFLDMAEEEGLWPSISNIIHQYLAIVERNVGKKNKNQHNQIISFLFLLKQTFLRVMRLLKEVTVHCLLV